MLTHFNLIEIHRKIPMSIFDMGSQIIIQGL